MSCASAVAAGGTQGYVVCGGGSAPDGSTIDTFEVTGVGGHGHAVRLLQQVPGEAPPKLAQAVKKASAAGEGDVLMIAGGYDDDSGGSPTTTATGVHVEKSKGYSSVWNMFNATSLKWTSGEWPSKVGRQYGVGVGCGGMLLFGGGQQSSGRSAVVDIFNTRANTWLPPAHLNMSRSNLAAGCMAGRYALFGGGQTTGHSKYVAEAMVDVYDTVENTWGQ